MSGISSSAGKTASTALPIDGRGMGRVLPFTFSIAEGEKTMRRISGIVLACMFLCCCAVATVHAAEALKDVHCAQQGFSTKIPAGLSAYWQENNGLYISVVKPGYVPCVLVWKGSQANISPAEYFRAYTAHIRKKYGARLRAFSIMEYYEVGGKKLPAARYIYDVEGGRLCLLRLIEARKDHTVAYTAKYINGHGEATLAALDVAVRYYRPGNTTAVPKILPLPPRTVPKAGGTRRFTI